MLRLIVTTGYLTATVSEVNDHARELNRRIRCPGLESEARTQARTLLGVLWRRPGALVVLCSLSGLVDVVAATLMAAAGNPTDAIGHFSTPFVMVLAILGLSEDADGKRTSSHSLRIGFIVWAFRAIALCSLVALVFGSGWSDGAAAARVLGCTALGLAVVGGLTPLVRWIHMGYSGWRARFAPILMGLAGGIGMLATIWELATMPSLTVVTAVSNLAGASALLVGCYVFAVLAVDPPTPMELQASRRK